MTHADEKSVKPDEGLAGGPDPGSRDREKVRFSVYGEEIIEKEVKASGNSGRVYLPPEWIGKRVKVIKISRSAK